MKSAVLVLAITFLGYSQAIQSKVMGAGCGEGDCICDSSNSSTSINVTTGGADGYLDYVAVMGSDNKRNFQTGEDACVEYGSIVNTGNVNGNVNAAYANNATQTLNISSSHNTSKFDPGCGNECGGSCPHSGFLCPRPCSY